MEYIVVGICALLYFAVGKNVECFKNISALGFQSECPQLYLTNPKAYHFVSYTLLVIVGVSPHVFDKNYGLILAFICWAIVKLYGRNVAFNRYRQILTEMARDESGIATEEEKKEYFMEAMKTNSELAKKMKDFKF
jgi:amino acid permease